MTHTEWPTVTRTYTVCIVGSDAPKQVACGLDHSVILTVGGQVIIPIMVNIWNNDNDSDNDSDNDDDNDKLILIIMIR